MQRIKSEPDTPHDSAPEKADAKKGTRRKVDNAEKVKVSTINALTGGGSLLWTILLIGVLLCGISVGYMMNVLERSNDGNGGLRKHSSRNHHKHADHADPHHAAAFAKHLSVAKKKQEVKRKAKEAVEDKEDKSNFIDSSQYPDKKRILDLARGAGITYIDKDTYDSLPTWEEVTNLYGDTPKIVGLDTCETFQKSGFKYDHFIGAAGNFNTGYHLLSELLINNCHMQDRMDKFGESNHGIRLQVPWGKHTPPGDEEFRLKHKTMSGNNVDAHAVLPVVTVRDPYAWMQSMCRHPYSARWVHGENCPNIVPTSKNRADHPELAGKIAIPVGVEYPEFKREYESMVHFWNEFNHEYKTDIDIPKLMVRYEDLLFHPHQVVKQACECAGGTMNFPKEDFKMVSQSLKRKSKREGGYLEAMINYGSAEKRFHGFQPHDLKYSNDNLNAGIMDKFGYSFYPKEKLLKSMEEIRKDQQKRIDAAEAGGVVPHDTKKKLAKPMIDTKEMQERRQSQKEFTEKQMKSKIEVVGGDEIEESRGSGDEEEESGSGDVEVLDH